jgi:hypothetical protein
MNKKILGIAVVLMAVAMLAVPVLAKPTNGPNKVAVTVTMTRNDGGGAGILLDDDVFTGPITHRHLLQGYDVTITFDDDSELIGTLLIERKVVFVPQKESIRRIFTDYYVFTFDGDDEDTGFVGNGKVIIDGVNGQSLGYGLFHGTGDFEGQTLNIGHGWEAFSSTPNPWIGYWLKP